MNLSLQQNNNLLNSHLTQVQKENRMKVVVWTTQIGQVKVCTKEVPQINKKNTERKSLEIRKTLRGNQ